MNQIAVLLNGEGVTGTFNEQGQIVIYEKISEEWIQKETISVYLEGNQENPREYLKEIGQQLEPCKSIVCNRMLGIAYHIFDRLKFDIWEVEGKPEDFLDYILKEMLKGDEEVVPAQTFINEVEDRISVDLISILKADPEQTSKKILQPILKMLCTRTLELQCDHIPKWLLAMEQKNEINLFTKVEEGINITTIKKA